MVLELRKGRPTEPGIYLVFYSRWESIHGHFDEFIIYRDVVTCFSDRFYETNGGSEHRYLNSDDFLILAHVRLPSDKELSEWLQGYEGGVE